jgi:putative nucleotidyltransferase with HDIG domain
MYRILLRLKRLIKKFLKVKAETRQAAPPHTISKVYRYIMLISAVSLIALLYPAGDLFHPLDFPRKGEIAQEDIIASSQITIMKSEAELKEEREAAAAAIPIIIEYNTNLVDSVLAKLDRFFAKTNAAAGVIKGLGAGAGVPDTTVERVLDSLKNDILTRYPSMRADVVERLLESGRSHRAQSIIDDILKNEIYFSGVLPDLASLPDTKTQSVILRIGKRDVFMVRDNLLDVSKAYVKFLAALNNRSLVDSFNVDDYYEVGRHFIVPNLSLNVEEMQNRRKEAMAEISPIREVVMVGDLIVRAGSQITPRQEKILEEMYSHNRALSAEESWFKPYVPVVARLLLVFAVFSIMYVYFYHHHTQIFKSNQKLLALFLIYGLVLLLIYFLGVKLGLSMYLYPIAIFSILITILFDAELAIFNSFILALLLGILHRFNFSLVLVTIVIGMVSAYSVQRVRRRSGFFRAILSLSVAYIALVVILESFLVSPSEGVRDMIGYGLVNAVVSPLLAMGILPIFESLFGFTTDITLLELSDLNNPLLKRLSLEAPGTYHHSILLGNLAEAAAKAINANPLLARVGAYYHDIGKMEIPEYFVENQLGIKSKHEELTPNMSAIILGSHIKKGRQIGENADLPDAVLNFIEEHHGTMTMSYFYNKAREMGIENPSVDDFRYPGPKPQAAETAIVMLADSVEAASRTLADPKPARIRNLVQNLINDRLQSGELEECPLTLKDLAQIRESFAQILIGVFHHRIEYPEKEDVK